MPIPGLDAPGFARRTDLVAIAPLLVASDTLVRGLALGAATLAVAWGTRSAAALLRRLPGALARTAACFIVMAGVLLLVGILYRTALYEVHLALGKSLALALANLAIVAEATALPAVGRRAFYWLA